MTKLNCLLSAGFLVTVLSLGAGNAFAQEDQGQAQEQSQGQFKGTSTVELLEPPTDSAEKLQENAAATSLLAQHLTLFQTDIRTEDGIFKFGTTPIRAFSGPTSLVCPANHSAGCTIKVEISNIIFSITPNSVAKYDVIISGSGQSVAPSQVVNMDSTNTGGLGSVRTMQFMKQGIPAGSTQTIDIGFFMGSQGATGNTGFRTMTIQLYLN